MPAVSPSPLLRRQLSEEARRILYDALSLDELTISSPGLDSISLFQVLSNLRCKVTMEIADVGTTSSASLVIHGFDVRVSYLHSPDDVELVILNKSGSVSKWVTHANGSIQQYRDYLHRLHRDGEEYKRLTSFVEISEMFDLMTAVSQSRVARRVRERRSRRPDRQHEQFITFITDFDHGRRFLYMLDPATGLPARIRQDFEPSDDPDRISHITLHLTEGKPSTGKAIDVPLGIKTDMQVTVDAAMEYFYKWDKENRMAVMNVFKAMDADCDGFITSEDLIHALQSAGQQADNAQQMTFEMIRLLTDADDPAEEFNFHQWCGFWLVMLADGNGVSDPEDQRQMVKGFRQMFYGEIHYQVPTLPEDEG